MMLAMMLALAAGSPGAFNVPPAARGRQWNPDLDPPAPTAGPRRVYQPRKVLERPYTVPCAKCGALVGHACDLSRYPLGKGKLVHKTRMEALARATDGASDGG